MKLQNLSIDVTRTQIIFRSLSYFHVSYVLNLNLSHLHVMKCENKSIPVTGRGGP
jgi:hypothetical protein